MTMVSLSEYPTTVRMAATTTRLTSRFITPRKAMVARMSCPVAATAASPNRHSNR
ncbi:hypothetical protein D3C83_265630 [compost metagenome]